MEQRGGSFRLQLPLFRDAARGACQLVRCWPGSSPPRERSSWPFPERLARKQPVPRSWWPGRTAPQERRP